MKTYSATLGTAFLLLAATLPAQAQHEHHAPPAAGQSAWTLMQDGVVHGLFNHQGGPRGGDEFKVPNWWMGMASRKAGKGDLTLTAMLSLDPATVGKSGYREIFQVGEALDGKPLIDHQHPHDFFMQLAAVWRVPLNDRTGFTLAGGPAGEPALGPVAFMHRLSSAENPIAPLGHHTFDSTHISYGVVTAAIDRGPWMLEASVFNGREPDQERWDFDFGRMDSVAGRVWFKPTDRWEFQLSTGRLIEPEELSHGNVQRTTASGSWIRKNGDSFTAVSAGYGANAAHETTRHAVFGELTRRAGQTSMFGRAEIVQVETDLLLNSGPPVSHETTALKDAVGAFTFGALRHVGAWRGFEAGFGGSLTLYAVPELLKRTHGERPVSFQIFFRVRSPAGAMGRMWNMRMSKPMAGHTMAGTMK
jgi:hypothetical protein